ncbi:MAG: MFS transporter [Gammaproteobacteria bacterium]|nr:MFS transporter [Gammaproteobacteria bacterium]
MSQMDSPRGWWNVGAAFIGLSLSYAMFTVFVFGTLVKPLQAEFGWGRAEMSFALTVTNITVVFGSPTIGLLVDRLGVKRLLIPSVALMGIAVAAMSLLNSNIWFYYLGFFGITFLGLGTLPLSYSRILIGWFERRRGLALGVALSGFGVGGALAPEVAATMTELYGWRSVYQLFAVLVIFLALPVSLFVLKEAPNGPGASPQAAVEAEAGLNASAAARTRDYWLILASFLLVGIGITSVLSHMVPMLMDRGMSFSAAARCMSTLAVALIFGRMLAGYLMDYFFAPFVTAAFIVFGLAGGIVLLALGAVGTWAFVAAALVGLATGSEISEIAYIVGRYFGQRAFGLIYGIMFGGFQLGSAVAAPMMGYYHDSHGDYIGALWGITALVLLGAVLIALLSPYPDKTRESS